MWTYFKLRFVKICLVTSVTCSLWRSGQSTLTGWIRGYTYPFTVNFGKSHGVLGLESPNEVILYFHFYHFRDEDSFQNRLRYFLWNLSLELGNERKFFSQIIKSIYQLICRLYEVILRSHDSLNKFLIWSDSNKCNDHLDFKSYDGDY